MPDVLSERLTALLAWFHRHPELAFHEVQTTAKIRETLDADGIPVFPGGTQTGLIAVIEGGQPGPVVGLRCDIDALPIQEESGLPYASCAPGVMHACGHDFHTTVMLGAAQLLWQGRANMRGTVKIAFQPAEETSAGAPPFLNTPLLSDASPFLAVHSYPGKPAGWVGVKEGAVMASVDRFKVDICGRGAHAAQPHKGVDPIVVQAAVIQALQTIVSRTLSPFSSSVVSVTHVDAGTTWNVIPEHAMLEGTVRTLSPEDRTRIEAAFRRTVSGVCQAMGAQASIDWERSSGAVINDPALCRLARRVAEACGLQAGRQEDTMGGEDFSYYLADRPGLFVRIGTGGDYPAHHPRFTVDPAALAPAARFFARLALACLENPGGDCT